MTTTDRNFQAYIEFLRENIGALVEYSKCAGHGMDVPFTQIKQDLFDDDPFVVFGATIAASAIFSNKNLYH